MKSIAIISTLIAITLAAPAPAPQVSSYPVPNLPKITQVTYRVSNAEDPNNILSATTNATVNGDAVNFDQNNQLVSAGKGKLNTNGFVVATRVDAISSLNGITCNLYDGDKHVIAVLSSENPGQDFDGVEGPNNKAVVADKYSLLCYYGL